MLFRVSYSEYTDGGNASCILKSDWTAPQSDSCMCNDSTKVFGETLGGLLDCLNGAVVLYPKYCVTSLNDSASGVGLLVGGMCPYIQLQRDNVALDPHADYATITARSCGTANRTGTLCGKCANGTSVAVTDAWSFRCVSDEECKPLNCFVYFFAEFGSLTLMFAFVYLFGINVASPYTSGYVTLAQIVPLYALNILRASRDYTALNSFVKFLLSLYSIWSLEVFTMFIPPLCCRKNISNMEVISLKYFGAIYPLLLVLGSYLLLKLQQWHVRPVVFVLWPLRACFRLIKIERDSTTLLTTFCTFVSLAFVKIFIISLMLLSNVDLKTESGEVVGTVLLYDGTIELWGREHLPHGIGAIVVLVAFFFLPCLALILYPLCNGQKYLSQLGCSARYIQYISAFMEVFYGHFKDGTGESRDYRCFGGLQFIFKFVLFFSILFGPTKINEDSNFIVLQVGTTLWGLLILVLQPYKKQKHAQFQGTLMLYISMIMSVAIYTNLAPLDKGPQYTFFALLFLPALSAIVVGLVLLVKRLRCCKSRRHRKGSRPVSPELIRSVRSQELSERFIDDRMCTYVSMHTINKME